jgi:hypothetical protein
VHWVVLHAAQICRLTRALQRGHTTQEVRRAYAVLVHTRAGSVCSLRFIVWRDGCSLHDATTAATESFDLIAELGPLYVSFSTGASAVNLTDVMALLANPAAAAAIKAGVPSVGKSAPGRRRLAPKLLAAINPSSGTVVGLFSDNSTGPGTLIQTIGTLPDSSLPPAGTSALIDFPVSPSVTLSANTRYWIGFFSASGSPARLDWTEDTSGTGVASEFHYTDGGATPMTWRTRSKLQRKPRQRLRRLRQCLRRFCWF